MALVLLKDTVSGLDACISEDLQETVILDEEFPDFLALQDAAVQVEWHHEGVHVQVAHEQDGLLLRVLAGPGQDGLDSVHQDSELVQASLDGELAFDHHAWMQVRGLEVGGEEVEDSALH